jgi:hypothetical protein
MGNVGLGVSHSPVAAAGAATAHSSVMEVATGKCGSWMHGAGEGRVMGGMSSSEKNSISFTASRN